MRNKLLLTLLSLVCVFCCVFGLAACDEHPDNPANTDVAVTEVKLEQSNATLQLGDSVTLSATVMPENATNKTVNWSSENPAVVTVDNNGKITAVSVGSAFVYAQCGNANSACSVRVVPKVITLDQTSLSMEEGEARPLTATVNAVNEKDNVITWTASPTGVVDIVESSDFTRQIIALKQGAATVTVTTGNGYSATCTVAVSGKKIEINRVEINPDELELEVGDSAKLVSRVFPDNAPQAVQWTVSPQGIVTVDDNGSVKAVGAGEATITATAGKVSATCSVSVFSYTPGLEFRLNDDGTAYSVVFAPGVADVVVPAQYEGLPVTTIWYQSFSRANIVNVTLPDSIEIIDSQAFSFCENLESINIPDGVTKIGSSAFANCRALTSITIPDAVVEFGDNVFYNCNVLESVTLGDGIKKITEGVFKGCSELQSLVLGENIDSINVKAFEDCKKLRYTSDESASYLGSEENEYLLLFRVNSTITSYTINSNTKVVNDDAFKYCNAVDIQIPDGVKAIGENAFYGTKVENLVLPDSVVSVGTNAFLGSAVTEIVLGSGLQSVDESAFFGMNALSVVRFTGNMVSWLDNDKKISSVMESDSAKTLYIDGQLVSGEVIVPQGVTSISDYAFKGCADITEITLPVGITYIGDSAFDSCSSLKEISIPEGVTSIGAYAFRWSGVDKVTLPSTIESIGYKAFEAAYASIYYNGDVGSWCAIDGLDEISSEVYIGGTLPQGELVIPVGTKEIKAGAFKGWKITSVVIPESVTKIGAGAFSACDSITSVTIPSGVLSVGQYAFSCSELISVNWNATSCNDVQWLFSASRKLETIVFGSNVKSIPNGLLSGINSLTTIVLNEGLETLGNISYLGGINSLVVPSTVTQMGDVTNCANLVEISVPQGLDISGLTFDNCPKFKGVLAGNCYVRGDKLTGVKSDAVLVIVPDTVTTIAANAFTGASGLKYVYIPQNVTSVEQNAFAGCENATVLCEGRSHLSISDITAGTKYLNVGKCTADGWIYSESGEEVAIRGYIGDGGEVTVPTAIDGKAVVSVEARGGANNLTSVFLGRSDITKITFNCATLNIEAEALENLANLTEICFGSNVTRVNMSKAAFEGCSQLNMISLAGGYANYQLVTAAQGQTPQTSDVVDASDLFAKINGAATGVACVIMLKSAA